MRIYLAGPMTGIPNFNFPAFDYATKLLRSQGHDVFNPAERDRRVHGDEVENNPAGCPLLARINHGFSLRDALEDDTSWICSTADAVALLPGWEGSKGACAERALAVALGLTIIHLGKEFVE